MGTITFALISDSLLLGIGLAMDAFSVSLANGLNEHTMNTGKMVAVAGTFAGFQATMPLIGWICIHTIAEKFRSFQKFIPWIALMILLYIGGKMLIEGLQETNRHREKDKNDAKAGMTKKVTVSELFLQGIATSIDALSVGFTTADYKAVPAVLSAVIIGAVTYLICHAGLILGKKFGTKLAGRASVFGGILLIAIGLKICMA